MLYMQFPTSDSARNSDERQFSHQQRTIFEKIKLQLGRVPNPLLPYLAISIPAAGSTPWDLFQHKTDAAPLFYWEIADRKESHLSQGVLKRFRATGESRFNDLSAEFESLRSQILSLNVSDIPDNEIPLISGGYSFEPYNVAKEWREFGSAQFILPKTILTQRDTRLAFTFVIELFQQEASSEEIRSSINQKDALLQKVRDHFNLLINEGNLLFEQSAGKLVSRDSSGVSPVIISSMNRPTGSQIDPLTWNNRRNWADELRDVNEKYPWIQRVDRAVEKIKEGEFQKVVLAREVTLDKNESFSAIPMMEQLRGEFPDCYLFLVKMESGNVFLGASPERLVKIHHQELDTDALAGSAPRGMSESEDNQLGSELVQSQKDRLEHHIVLQKIVDSLSDFSSKIVYSTTPGIKKLKNVQHLHTPVRASLEKDVSMHKILGMLHPTPAVGGYPVKSALPYIQDLEKIDRGWYAGTVGWFNSSGNGEFAVSIRSSFIDSTQIHLYAGCGIVEHSDPDLEWEETCLKLESLYAATQVALADTKDES